MPLTTEFNSQAPTWDNEVLQPLPYVLGKCEDGLYPLSCKPPSLDPILPQGGMSHVPGHLLFGFYPLGGLVMISDLVASYCHKENKKYQMFFEQVFTLEDVFERLVANVDKIREGPRCYDPWGYSLREMLKLLTKEGVQDRQVQKFDHHLGDRDAAVLGRGGPMSTFRRRP